MSDDKSIVRMEYYELVADLVKLGKFPKSHRSRVQSALTYLYEPKTEASLNIYNRYISAVPNVPNNLRAEMDKLILDEMVLEKRLSGVSRDKLLHEISMVNLYHGGLVQKLIDESNEAIKRIGEGQEKMKEAERRAPFEIAAVLSVIAVVVVMAWSAFANWVNRQPDYFKQSDEKTIPGFGITASEYERRSNCRNFGC
jgi:hypothetical protein